MYMLSDLKTPDQIEELVEVQGESTIVLTNEIRPLTAANRDARNLDSQCFKAALLPVNGCSTCSTANVQDRSGLHEFDNPIDLANRE